MHIEISYKNGSIETIDVHNIISIKLKDYDNQAYEKMHRAVIQVHKLSMENAKLIRLLKRRKQ